MGSSIDFLNKEVVPFTSASDQLVWASGTREAFWYVNTSLRFVATQYTLKNSVAVKLEVNKKQ